MPLAIVRPPSWQYAHVMSLVRFKLFHFSKFSRMYASILSRLIDCTADVVVPLGFFSVSHPPPLTGLGFIPPFFPLV